MNTISQKTSHQKKAFPTIHIKRKYLGLVYSLLAALFFSGMSTFIKLAGDLPSPQKAFFRNLPALIIMAYTMLNNHESFKISKKNMGPMLGRVFFGTCGVLCNFYAIDRMVLSDSNILNKLSPFFAILFSIIILKEKLKPVQGLGVIAAFIGALFIVKPSGNDVPVLPAIAGVLSGMGAGIAYTFVRKMGNNGENGKKIVFYFSLFSCGVTLPYCILSGHTITPTQFLILTASGLFSAAGQICITRAYFYAPARELSVYDYTQVLYAAIWGYFLFGQVPDGLSIIGYIIIIGSAIFMFMYNNHLGPFKAKEITKQS